MKMCFSLLLNLLLRLGHIVRADGNRYYRIKDWYWVSGVRSVVWRQSENSAMTCNSESRDNGFRSEDEVLPISVIGK